MAAFDCFSPVVILYCLNRDWIGDVNWVGRKLTARDFSPEHLSLFVNQLKALFGYSDKKGSTGFPV